MEARGVRKVNEAIMKNGRSLVITENDDSKILWEEVPEGSLKVDKKTGTIYAKLEGETTWLPAGIRSDGTLCIDRDTNKFVEVFTITNPDDGSGRFSYTNAKGENRTKRLAASGFPLFELEEGCYILNRNNLSVFIDDKGVKNKKNKQIVETDEIRFALKSSFPVGTVVTAEYFASIKIGNPYPRFFINVNEPAVKEYGDFWVDTDDFYLNAGDGPTIKWWNGTSWITIGKNTFIWLNAKLDKEIADRIADVDQEERERKAADDAERAARIAADNAEAQARASVDGGLQSEIDALKRSVNKLSDTGAAAPPAPSLPPQPPQVTTSGSTVSVISGALRHGDTIPLPSGYTQDQCHWMVSMHYGYLADCNAVHSGSFSCYADSNRVVTCLVTRWTDGGGYNPSNGTAKLQTEYGHANYIIIGVK